MRQISNRFRFCAHQSARPLPEHNARHCGNSYCLHLAESGRLLNIVSLAPYNAALNNNVAHEYLNPLLRYGDTHGYAF